MVQKHVAFAPASQKQLGSRLRSPLLQRGTVPAQPFSRFFTIQLSPSSGTRRSGASSMSERSELRRRREERMENGVKNLKGARLFPITFSNHGFGDDSFMFLNRLGMNSPSKYFFCFSCVISSFVIKNERRKNGLFFRREIALRQKQVRRTILTGIDKTNGFDLQSVPLYRLK